MNNTFADFFKLFKAYIEKSYLKENLLSSDVDILEHLLNPLIKMKNITNKNGDLLYLDKSRVSRIITNKDNLPTTITDECSFLKTNKGIQSEYVSIFKKCIPNTQVAVLLYSLGIKEYNNDPYEYLYFHFINCLCGNNIRSTDNSILIWRNGCNSLKLTSGDIFDYCFSRKSRKEIITIPVNTTFDTHVSTKIEKFKPLVSSETLHGKWIQRCKNAELSEKDIQNKINDFLNSHYLIDAKIDEYSIGTIVPFDTANGLSYLVALTVFDDNNVAHSNEEDVKIAIKELIRFYDFNGQGYSLYIPLLGTGRSRIGLSNKESFELIKNTLLDEKEHIQGSVNIIALPEVFEELTKGECNAK